MTETTKQAQPKREITPEEPKKTEGALDDKQLDQTTGGQLKCVKGEHIKTGTITV